MKSNPPEADQPPKAEAANATATGRGRKSLNLHPPRRSAARRFKSSNLQIRRQAPHPPRRSSASCFKFSNALPSASNAPPGASNPQIFKSAARRLIRRDGAAPAASNFQMRCQVLHPPEADSNAPPGGSNLQIPFLLHLHKSGAMVGMHHL